MQKAEEVRVEAAAVLSDQDWANKAQARREKWEALKVEMNQPRLQEMRNMEKYAMNQPRVKAAFERHTAALGLLKTIQANETDDIFVRPLYNNSAMTDRPKGPGELPDRDTILRKNIYYLSHAVEYVKELVIQLTQNGFITLYQKDDIEKYQEPLLQCVALFVMLFKMELNVNLLSKLVGVLYLTGNTAAADIIMEAKRLAEQVEPVPAAVLSPVIPRNRDAESIQGAAAGGGEWGCQNCTFLNSFQSSVCGMCFKSKDFMEARNNSSLECVQCTFINPPRNIHCDMCGSVLGQQNQADDEWSEEDDDDKGHPQTLFPLDCD